MRDGTKTWIGIFQSLRKKPAFLVVAIGIALLALLFTYFGMIRYELRTTRHLLSTATRVEVKGNLLRGTNDVVPVTKTITNSTQVAALSQAIFGSLNGVTGLSRYRGESYATMLEFELEFYSGRKPLAKVNVIGTSTVVVNKKIAWTAKDEYGLYHKLRSILEIGNGDRKL
jgi:hypothetical protein